MQSGQLRQTPPYQPIRIEFGALVFVMWLVIIFLMWLVIIIFNVVGYYIFNVVGYYICNVVGYYICNVVGYYIADSSVEYFTLDKYTKYCDVT